MPDVPKRVLVVDDEPAVRDLVTALLRNSGYVVETAPGGTEALEKVEAGAFDVVFTDLVMPGMKGDQLAREIKTRRPTLPVVLLTGHKPAGLSTDFACILQKPFTRDELRRTIASLV